MTKKFSSSILGVILFFNLFTQLYGSGFPAGTLITIPYSQIPIEELKENQTIQSFSGTTHWQEESQVIRMGTYESSEQIKITFTNGFSFLTAPKQKFYCHANFFIRNICIFSIAHEGYPWIAANDLQVGDKIKQRSGDYLEICHLERIYSPQTLYVLEAVPHHQLYVTEQELMAHNSIEIVIGVTWLFGCGSIEFGGFFVNIFYGAALGSWIMVNVFGSKARGRPYAKVTGAYNTNLAKPDVTKAYIPREAFEQPEIEKEVKPSKPAPNLPDLPNAEKTANKQNHYNQYADKQALFTSPNTLTASVPKIANPTQANDLKSWHFQTNIQESNNQIWSKITSPSLLSSRSINQEDNPFNPGTPNLQKFQDPITSKWTVFDANNNFLGEAKEPNGPIEKTDKSGMGFAVLGLTYCLKEIYSQNIDIEKCQSITPSLFFRNLSEEQNIGNQKIFIQQLENVWNYLTIKGQTSKAFVYSAALATKHFICVTIPEAHNNGCKIRESCWKDRVEPDLKFLRQIINQQTVMLTLSCAGNQLTTYNSLLNAIVTYAPIVCAVCGFNLDDLYEKHIKNNFNDFCMSAIKKCNIPPSNPQTTHPKIIQAFEAGGSCIKKANKYINPDNIDDEIKDK